MTTTSDLARELGAIASGEAFCIKRGSDPLPLYEEHTKRFATGLVHLIDERIALGRAAEHNPPSDDAEPAVVAIGDTFARGDVVGEVTRITHGGPCTSYRLDGPGVSIWFHDVAALTGPGATWTRVRAVDVPGVAVGDTFLRLTDCQDFREGDVSVVVADNGAGKRHPFNISGGRVSTEATASADWLLHSGEWQRVPAGYTLPTATEFHAAIRRLVAARDGMREDPATGTTGVDDCIEQMRAMAGMVAR